MLKLSKTLAYSIVFSVCMIYSCAPRETSRMVEGGIMAVDSQSVDDIDPETDAFIEQYRAVVMAEMNDVIAISAQTMRKGTPEDLLNNFVADLVLYEGQGIYDPEDGQPIDFCVLNYGGLRTSIPQGNVTRSRIYELMPFDNEMVVLTITPENAQELFRYIASRTVGTPVSGLKMGIRDRNAEDVLVQGVPFSNNRNYKVLTSDYLADAGDNMRFFANPLQSELLGLRIRDAIIQHLIMKNEKGEMISSELDGRLYYK